jgi:hypothetical protein
MRKVILTFLVLTFLLIPVLGEELKSENFAEPEIKVMNKTYLPDETKLVFEPNKYITLDYTIKPKSDEDLKKIDGRKYYTSTDLKNVKAKYTLQYKDGAILYKIPFNVEDGVKVDDWQYGLEYMKINLTGYTPNVEERFKSIYALRIRVQDGGYIIPPVVIYVINYDKFQKDLNDAQKKYDDLNKILTSYAGKSNTSELAKLLNLAGGNLTLAKENYKDKNYIRADEKLKFAETWLDQAEKVADGVVAEYLYKQAQDTLTKTFPNLDKIYFYLKEIRDQKLANTSVIVDYESRYTNLKNKATQIQQDLGSVKAFLDAGRYKDAKDKADKTLKDAKKLQTDVDNLLKEIKSLVPEVTPTVTTTVTPTPTVNVTVTATKTVNKTAPPPVKIDWGRVGFFVGVVVVGGIVVVIVASLLRKYMRRRRWDELR